MLLRCNDNDAMKKQSLVLRGLLLTVLPLIATAMLAQQVAIAPVDEAPSNPDFLAFRTRLLNTIARHDTDSLLAVVHPEIKAGFGGEEGIEAFKDMWNIAETKSEIWEKLGAVLALGGTFDSPDEFTAPYTFSRWPGDVDPFDYVAVTGSNVRIRKEPAPDAPILTSVGYLSLKLDEEALQTDWTQKDWTSVQINGQKGYIATRFIRSPIDYRARFSRVDGRWQLTMFLSGD